MDSFTITAVLLVLTVVGTIILQTCLLYTGGKIFKVSSLGFPSAVKISVFAFIISLIVEIVLGLFIELPTLAFDEGLFLDIVSITGYTIIWIISAVIVYRLLMKYANAPKKAAAAIAALTIFIGTIVSIGSISLIRAFIVEPFIVEGTGMEPTYVEGDYLFIQKFDRHYDRGDVITYYQKDESYRIQRIIGLPGEEVLIADGVIFVNGEPSQIYGIASTIAETTLAAGQGEYIALGDNNFAEPTIVLKEHIIGEVWAD